MSSIRPQLSTPANPRTKPSLQRRIRKANSLPIIQTNITFPKAHLNIDNMTVENSPLIF